MLLRPAVASLLLIASASAVEDFWLNEELPFVDIRLGYALQPRPDSYSVYVANYPSIGGAEYERVDAVDGNRTPAVTYSIVGGTIDPVGPLFGAEISYASDSQQLTGQTIAGAAQPLPAEPTSLQYRTIGGSALAGIGWAINRYVHLEGLGVLGIGTIDLDFADPTGALKSDGEGWYWNAGVRGGIYFTWRKLAVGALVEYSQQSYRAGANWADSRTTVDDSVSGVGTRIEIGYHIQ